MRIIQQLSVWGELDDKWKIMRAESETTWHQLRNKEQHGTNWGTRSVWLESSASRSESLNKYLEWHTITRDRLSTVTQCQKKHKWPVMKEFGDLYKFDQWIRTNTIFTVQNKWDRCGFFTRDIWSLKSSHKVGTHKILLFYSRIFPFLIWILYWYRASKWDTWGWGRLQCACTAPAPQHNIWCVVCMICVRGNKG